MEFMENFYGFLKEGQSKRKALSKTKKMIKAKYPNPFYWSVFVLYGE